MKVILLKDLAKVGQAYEVKDVADGYGRNLIIARGLGLAATPANLRRLEAEQARRAVTAKIQRELLMKSLADLAGQRVTITAKANPEGHLFAGVHAANIVQALKEQTNLDLPPEMIILDQPLKTTGEFTIKVKAGRAGSEAGDFRLVIEHLPS